MLFLLNHSTGALVVHADNRSQVLKWIERQLGSQAALTSIVEMDEEILEGWVERSGTGVVSSSPAACGPKLSLMADSIQGLEGVGVMNSDAMDWYRRAALRSRTTAVH